MADVASLASDATGTVPQSNIDALLASLRDRGAERFDAAGWHYLDTLARRAAGQEGSVRRMLEAKLQPALANFADRLAHAHSAAAELLAVTSVKHPQAATELQRLFDDGDLRGLRHLSDTLDARAQCAVLLELASQLESAVPGRAGDIPAHSVASPTKAAASPALELKTVRESRSTWARLSVDKQLALAMKQAPQNAGPINSHMLVLRSLAKMQAMSPDYLNRMVSYVDTLLCLDPGEVLVPAKKKKPAAAKSGKPAKAMRK
jgi:hypothetical protein